jgi:hypothetical protein
VSTGDDSGILNIQTNETTAITVDASQNVGIGTASPASKLHVYNAGDVTTTIGSNTGASIVSLISNSNGSGAYNAILSTTTSGENWYLGGLGNSNTLAIRTAGTERMRINSSGQVMVNTTSLTGSPDQMQLYPATTGAFQYGMMIGGNGFGYTVYAMRFLNTYTPAVVGSIVINNTTTSFNTSSDYRLKENIAPMTGALAKVALLKPVTYKWKSDGSNGEGFIAHELAEVVPQAVTGAKDAFEEDGTPHYQGIDTSFLVATLTAALQETKALIDTQAETINALTARIVALEGQ